jgi:nuclear pore complex protein Nup155
MPYEAVSSKVQSIAHRTSLDSFVFPIQMLLPELCRYAVAFQQDETIGADAAWPVRLFLSLGVSHDLIIRVLENIFDTQDYGFRGSTRHRVIELIAVAAGDWVAEVRRRGGAGKGGSLGPGLGELLGRCVEALPAPGHGSNPGGASLADVRLSLRQTQREIDGLVERVPTGSLRFM